MLFFPSLTFKRLRRAAPAVANWRCQFAKFSSRVQIEPNARMLVNNKKSAIKWARKLSNPEEPDVKHSWQRGCLVIGKSFKWCGCRLFVCFLICFCHEGGRRVRPVGGWWRPRVLGCPLSRPCAPPQSAPTPGPSPTSALPLPPSPPDARGLGLSDGPSNNLGGGDGGIHTSQ